jgi:hypothetical protein
MRVSVMVSAATIAGFVGALFVLGSSPEPDDRTALAPEPVNEVIGDESFAKKFGRAPTDDDEDLERVRTHLAYVERRLREIDDAHIPAHLRASRRANLDLLRRYWQAGIFPLGESPTSRHPTFIDDAGRRCAVAYLVEASAGTSAVDRINLRFRNAYIREIDDPVLDAWIAGSGLTRREVMTIQPSYDRRYQTWDLTRWHLISDASALYLSRVGGPDIAAARHIAGVDVKLQLIDLSNQWLVGGETAGGRTLSGATFYRFGLRGGAMPISGEKLRGRRPALIATLGSGVDGIAGVVPIAITVPLGLLFSFDTTEHRFDYDDAHEFMPLPIVQFRAEGEWIAWGRPQKVAWTAGFDLIWRLSVWSTMTGEQFRPRDLIASVTVTEFAGTIYGGVAIGIGFWSLTTEKVRGYHPNAQRPPLGPYW